MNYRYLLPLLALSGATVAQAQDQNEGSGQTIIVTGTSLSQTERNLRDCLARNCPPDEDIAATLAHAEYLFVAGDYEKARRTTKASLGRNNRHADRFPVGASDPHRPGCPIGVQPRRGKDFRPAAWGIKRALNDGLPKNDVRLVGADLEVAGMQAALGRTDSARAI